MRIDMMEIVGIVAACCTTASFLPQVIHTWRTKSVGDLSLRMYLLLTSGVILWLWYGLHIESISIILANAMTLFLVCAILVMKVVYGKRPPSDSSS